jgi:hypothetical protein
MAQLDGKQLKDLSVGLGKLNQSGLVTFNTGATMSFGSGAVLRTETANINAANDVVNKEYVDAVASGLDTKAPVKTVSATGSITLSGIGFQIDSYTVSAFDRILVAAQAGPNIATSSNGIYIATSSAWYRADDADGNPNNEVSHGNYVFVTEGNLFEHSGWVLTLTDASNSNNILVGTDSQGWVQFSESTQLNAGDGLYSVGRVINVLTGTGLTISGDAVAIANTTVTTGSYGQANAVTTFTVNAQGQLTNAGTQSINILASQVSDFTTAAETAIFTDSNFTDGITITFSVTNGNSVTAEVQPASLTASRFNIINPASASSGWQLGYNNSGQFEWFDPTLVGDITSVVAGNGLTGGGSNGSVTLDLNVGNGIEIVDDYVGLGGTLSRTTILNGDSNDLYFDNFENLVFTSSVFDVMANGLVSLDAGTGSVQILGDDGVTLSSNLGDIDLTTNLNLNITATSSSITVTSLKGLEYAADYSATFATNSLVSRKYVDNAVAVINGDLITGVTAGTGLTGGGTAGFVTLSVNLGVNSGLTFSADDIIISSNIAGTGLDFTSGVLSVNTSEITSALAGNGLTANSGQLDVNVNSDSLEISADVVRLKNTITGDRTFQDSVTVGGNLTVNGTVSYIYTENLMIEDRIITLNATFSTGTPFLDAGIEVLRGSSQSAALIWDETLDLWAAGLSGSTSTLITEAGIGLTKSGNTLSTDILVNGGLTYSGTSLKVDVDNSTITIVNGKLQGAAQGILGVTAGTGLTGGGSGPNYITLDVNLGVNSGLTFSVDDIIIADTIAGSGLTFSAGVISVNTANGLFINGDNVEVADTIAGSGLTFSAGVISVNTANGLTINSDNVEVADTIAGSGLTFSAGVININTANGLTINSDNVEVADTIAGSGLTFSSGVINVNVANGLVINSDNVEVADTIAGSGLTFSNGVIDMVWSGTSSGLTFSNDAVAVVVDGTTIAINGSGQLSVISGSAKPVYQSGTASTIGDNQATFTFSSTPNDYSRIEVFVNGQRQRLGDGVTTNDCYISSTSSIAENLENVVSGQTLYWNGTIAGFDLSPTDVIELIYES